MESISLLNEKQDFGNWLIRSIERIFLHFIYWISQYQSSEKISTSQWEKINSATVRIINLYGNDILRMAYSYLHNMEDAEDIVQDVLICYWRKAPDKLTGMQEKVWLLKVAANLSKNKLRYKKIREADELSDMLVREEREDLSFVWEAVKELPANYREAIHLYYYEGYSTSDISNILERNESSVRSDLRRGREQLRGILKEAYDFG